MIYHPGWFVDLMHANCPECAECTEAAIKHANLTDGIKATSSFMQTHENRPNTLVHAATVTKRRRRA